MPPFAVLLHICGRRCQLFAAGCPCMCRLIHPVNECNLKIQTYTSTPVGEILRKMLEKERLIIKLCVQLCLLCHLLPSGEPFCFLRTPFKFANFWDNEREVHDIFLNPTTVSYQDVAFSHSTTDSHLATVNKPGASTGKIKGAHTSYLGVGDVIISKLHNSLLQLYFKNTSD